MNEDYPLMIDDEGGAWQSGGPNESYVYVAEAGPGGPGSIRYTETYPQGSEAPSVDLRVAEGYLREIHLLRKLVTELSLIYCDQDEETIRRLHEELHSDDWPQWAELEPDAWGSRSGADPAAAGPSLTEEGLVREESG